jgi:tetratricopeptide (TPR) repeat protein
LSITLNTMGWNEAQKGEYRRAIAICRRALRLARRLGDSGLTANTLDSLGFAHRGLGQLAESVACYERAVALLRRLDDPFLLAKVLDRLGDVRHQLGQPRVAALAWRQAAHLLHELRHPAEAEVNRKLAGAGPHADQAAGHPEAGRDRAGR